MEMRNRKMSKKQDTIVFFDAEDNEINGAESGDDINNVTNDTEKTTD